MAGHVVCLGSAEIKIGLPFPLSRQKNHNAKVWVFPDTVQPGDWTHARPDRYLSRALGRLQSRSGEEMKSDEVNTIQIEVHSIPPRKYWARVVLDRPGFLPYNAFSNSRRAKDEEYENNMLPMKYVEGDYESTASMIFEVKAQQTSKVRLICDRAVTTGDPKLNLEMKP